MKEENKDNIFARFLRDSTKHYVSSQSRESLF